MISGEDFSRLFRDFQRTAFRLETLSVYDVAEEQEEFAAFLAGEPMDDSWHDSPWVRSMTDLGKELSRVHVLRSPLTDYLRYELAAYPGNTTAGENIGIIDLAHQEVNGLPDHDFWLFDDAEVYRMHYTDAGQFIGAELLPGEAVQRYQGYRDIARKHAMPFANYYDQLPRD